VLDLVYGEFILREEMGEAPAVADYLARFPELADALGRQFELHGALAAGSLSLSAAGNDAPPSEALTLAPPAPAASEACTLPPMPAQDAVAPSDAAQDPTRTRYRQQPPEGSGADEQAKEARQQTYFAQIGRVEAQLQAGDHAGAAGMLERVGQEQRGWEYGYLRRRTEGTPCTLRGQTSIVSAVSYSPDGTRLASASYDGTVKVWDARSGTELLTLRGHTAPVTAVSYSPDGTRLASASADTTVKVWDARTPALVPNYDPWTEAEARYQALAPRWHTEDAEAAEKAGDKFAAQFHRRWLAEHKPDNPRK
jgi:hypothetical protein